MPSIGRNYLYNVAYQTLVLILPLATAPYVSRTLGVEGVGAASFSQSVAAYFVLFAMLGVNNYGQREVARVRGNKMLLRRTFWEVWAMQAATSAATSLVYVAWASWSGYAGLALLWLPHVASAALDVNWLLFGLEEFRLTVARNTAVKLATFCLTFVLVRGETALAAYCLLMSVSTLVSAAALWPHVLRRVPPLRPTISGVLRHVRPNLLLFVPVVAVSLYTVLDKVMLGAMAGPRESGLFESATKISSMPFSFVAALGTVMLPRMSALLAAGDSEATGRYMGASVWLALLLSSAFAGGIVGVAPVLCPAFFGQGFEGAALPMCLIALDMPFMAWANVLRTQWLIPAGRDREYVSSIVVGAASNVAVNLALIPRLGAVGAAAGTLVAEAAVCLVQAWGVRGELPQLRWLAECWPAGPIGAAMCLLVRAVGAAMGPGLATLAVQVATGVASYSLMALAWVAATRNPYWEGLVRPWLARALGRTRG